jgi:putative MATE family efflux protein
MKATEIKENVKVNSTENKMGVMPMTKLIFNMSLPAIFSMTVMAMYNIVDSVFIGRYDQDGLTAVSLAYPLQMLLIAVAVGTAVGVNSLISRKLGENNQKEADDAATHGFFTCFISSAIFIILGLLISRPFMELYTQNDKIIEYGTNYLVTVLCFSIFSIIQCMIEKILQSTGDMIYPMLFQLVGAIVNVIFDPLLIFGIGVFPEMGVLGAAIATVFGQFCGMVFALIVIFKKENKVKIKFKGFKFNKYSFKKIYAVGFPSIIMQSIGSVMIIGMNAILSASQAAVTVLGIYYKLQSFVFMPCFGLNQGLMPILGYNYGAKNKSRMYSALKRGITIAVIIMSVGTIMMWTIPDVLVSLFGGTDELKSLAESAFRIISLCFIPAAAGIIFTTLFQAVGKGIKSLLMSFCRQLVLILPVAFIRSKTLGIDSVWYAFPIAEIGSLTLAIVFFLNLVKGDFKKLNK